MGARATNFIFIGRLQVFLTVSQTSPFRPPIVVYMRTFRAPVKRNRSRGFRNDETGLCGCSGRRLRLDAAGGRTSGFYTARG